MTFHNSVCYNVLPHLNGTIHHLCVLLPSNQTFFTSTVYQIYFQLFLMGWTEVRTHTEVQRTIFKFISTLSFINQTFFTLTVYQIYRVTHGNLTPFEWVVLSR